MARKLPWQTSQGTTTTDTTKPAAGRSRNHTKQKSTSPPTSHDTSSTAADDARIRRRKRQRSRTPSTSPPPAPLPVIELMHEGLDADDAYIMVEDEFQTVAQSFTAHLHHAEYKRLMTKAKERKKTEGECTDLDGKTEQVMAASMGEAPDSVTLKLRQRRLAAKQERELGRLSNAGLNDDGSSEDTQVGNVMRRREAATDEEEADMKDPLAGTKLAGLMAERDRKKISLKGLERLSTATRAAHGFGPSTLNESKRSKREVDTKSALNTPTKSVSFQSIPAVKHTTNTKVSPERSTIDKARKARPAADFKLHRTTGRSFVDDLDDFDTKAWDRRQAAEVARLTTNKDAKLGTREDSENTKKSRLDEVPVFLI